MGRLLCVMSVALALAGGASRAVGESIPFVYTDGLIRVEGRARGVEGPLWFLLDSGAAVSVLNRGTANRLGLRDGDLVTVKGMGAEKVGRWPQKLRTTVGATALPSRFLVVDLEEFEEKCAFPVDGLIGADFFEGRVVEIDFRTQRIRLEGAVRSKVNSLPSTIPLKRSRGVWLVNATVNGESRQRLRLDTGCATGLHWVTRTISDAAPVIHTVGLATADAHLAHATVDLGSVRLAGVPAALHDQRFFAGEDGLLGNAFLSRFGVAVVDGRSGRLLLGDMTPR